MCMLNSYASGMFRAFSRQNIWIVHSFVRVSLGCRKW